jgi:hypothetical protein
MPYKLFAELSSSQMRSGKFLSEIGVCSVTVVEPRGVLTADTPCILGDTHLGVRTLEMLTSCPPAYMLLRGGQMAILPPILRAIVTDEQIQDYAKRSHDFLSILQRIKTPEDPKAELPFYSNAAAIAWAWAAGQIIGLSDEEIIAPDLYPFPQDILTALQDGSHSGIADLVTIGMCAAPTAYPHLKSWLQTQDPMPSPAAD